MARLRRRPSLTAAVAAVSALVVAGCGASGQRDAGTGGGATQTAVTLPDTAAGGSSGSGGSGGSGAKAAPRWETVVTLSGTGSQQPAPFTILPGAIQWRARWSCENGSLRVTSDPPPRRPGPFVDTQCPRTGEAFAINTGRVQLTLAASGPWKLIVDQQLDTPLYEPPLEGLDRARLLGEGNFRRVEKDGGGVARLYQLPDERRALRFETFEVSTNTDLFVWLTDVGSPSTTEQIVSGSHWVLGNLKSTVGDQNYLVPPDVPLERVRSVVIWCDPVKVAYTAAPLSR